MAFCSNWAPPILSALCKEEMSFLKNGLSSILPGKIISCCAIHEEAQKCGVFFPFWVAAIFGVLEIPNETF